MGLVDYTEFLVKSICKKPDMVSVSAFEFEEGLMLEVIVHEDDKGIVIGRSGNTIKALRTLVKAKSYLEKFDNVKINVDSF